MTKQEVEKFLVKNPNKILNIKMASIGSEQDGKIIKEEQIEKLIDIYNWLYNKNLANYDSCEKIGQCGFRFSNGRRTTNRPMTYKEWVSYARKAVKAIQNHKKIIKDIEALYNELSIPKEVK